MNDVHYSLDVPQGVAGFGTPKTVRDIRDKYVQIEGTFVATIQIEGRIGTAWVALFAAVVNTAGGGIFSVPQTVNEIRTNVTVWTSGQPIATLQGFGVRDC